MADNLIQMQHSTKGPSGLSHGRDSFDSDENGVITIPSHVADEAKAHGFSADVVAKAPKVLAKLAKGGEAEETDSSSDGKSGDSEKESKAPAKGAKLAKGGDQ